MSFPIQLPVKLVIMSHLSDAQEMLTIRGQTPVSKTCREINFAKFLLLKYSNTDVLIDADVEYLFYLQSEKKEG